MISMLFPVYKSTASLSSTIIYSSASKQPIFCPLSRKQASGSKVNIATVPFTVHYSLFKHGSTVHGYYSRFLFCLFKEARASFVNTLHLTLHFTFHFSLLSLCSPFSLLSLSSCKPFKLSSSFPSSYPL